ncbi:hypothetical protein SNE40_008260 [Patella caerulea]|uniref:Uncharacterized protein n=1 Tax=Patella caerulea TaxID=87958 RepID=A0AAN8K586_PATCE
MLAAIKISRAVPYHRFFSRIEHSTLPKCPVLMKIYESGVLKTSKHVLPFRRFATKVPKKFIPKYSVDKVDRSYVLIMESVLKRYPHFGQYFLILGTLPIIIADVYFIVTHFDGFDKLLQNEILQHVLGSVFCVCMLVLVNTIVRRTILRIYHKPKSDQFIAILPTTKKIEFTSKDCTKGLMRMKIGNVEIKNKPYFVSPNDFQLPYYFNIIKAHEQISKSSKKKA